LKNILSAHWYAVVQIRIGDDKRPTVQKI